MISGCQELIDSYIAWLGKRIKIEEINGICEITTPFVDHHNDYIQIYIKKENSSLILTDDGYTLRDLELSGVDLNSEKRKLLLNSTLNGFGVKRKQDELFVEANPRNFPQKKHNFIQAILAVGDLFITARATVTSIFKEDVERYFIAHKIRFTPSVKFSGKSGFDQYFDFVIPASEIKPERILRVINRPNKQNITNLIFSWSDTKETRKPDSIAYGILNDSEQGIKKELLSALEQYGIKALVWSRRAEYAQELAA